VNAKFVKVLLGCVIIFCGHFVTAGEIILTKKIQIAQTEREEYFPQISYSPTDKRFLVAWIDKLWGAYYELESRIRTRFLKPDDTQSPARTCLRGHNLDSLLLQYDSDHNQYFLISNLPTCKYRLLGPNGGMIKAGNIPDTGLTTTVTYHPLVQEYLTSSPLHRFSYKGVPIGTVKPVGDFGTSLLLPDPGSTNYFLFYGVSRESRTTIYLQVVRFDGTALGQPRPILQDWYVSSVAFNPLRREFLILYYSPLRQWRALRITERGYRIGPTIILATKPEAWSAAIFCDDHFVIGYNQASRIYVKELNADGRAMGSAVPVTEMGHFAFRFSIARGEGKKFVIVWDEEDNDGITPNTSYDVFARFFDLP